jgi:hypothetical protein
MAEPLPNTDFGGVVALMARSGVECILIGGLAAAVHGSAHVTYDIDFCYRRTRKNLERLVATLAPYSPYLRGAPPGLPFEWSVATVQRGLNFTLITSLGAVDLLGEVAGGGTYDEILPYSEVVALFGTELRCASLPMLIRLKRAAGRPKDLDMLAGLEALQEEREALDGG